MKRNALTILTLGALALAALPAGAQRVAQTTPSQSTARRPSVQAAPYEIVSLHARVQGRSHVYSIVPAEPIPIAVGERIRLDLFGTAVVNGNRTERVVNARFEEAAGRDRISIVQAGPNWVIVEAKKAGDTGTAQISFDTTDTYETRKSGLRGGRITFEIGGGTTGTGSLPVVRQDDRWRRAQDLNDALYRSILNEQPRGTRAENDLEHIYRLGYAGVRDVALELAEEAEGDYRGLSEDQAVEVLGDLYRGLLRRNASDRELWETDRGFRGNVSTLRDRGLTRIVQVILDSEEFRSVNQLFQWGPLPSDQLPRGYNSESWRRERDRFRY